MSSLEIPKPVDAFPCASRSTIRTLFFTAAKAVPRFIAVVVFPTPPFWLATEIIEVLKIISSFIKVFVIYLF